MFQSLPRLNTNDRRIQVAVGAVVLLPFSIALVRAITTENLQLTIYILLGIASPTLIFLALRQPLFPYALYVIAVPFDNLLSVSGVGTITKMLGFAAILFMVIHIVRHKRFSRPGYPLYFFFTYLVFNILSMLWTRDVQGGIIDAQILASTIALYAVLAIAPITERDLRIICSCIVVSGVGASVFGIYVLHNVVNTAGDSGRLMIDVGNRTVDPNHYANSLLAPLALALVALTHARNPARLIVAFSAVIILGAGIEISLSREALIAAFVMALILAGFSRRRFASFLTLVMAAFLVPLIFPAIGLRMMGALSTGGAGRTSIWHIQWRSFLEHPIFGWGLGSAALAYNRNFLSVYQTYSAGWNMASHNTSLHILVDLGIVGLILAGLGILASFNQMNGIRRGDSLYPLRAGLTAALGGVVIVSFFIDLATYKYLWLVLTTAVQFGSVARARATKTSADDVKSQIDFTRNESRFALARGLVLIGGLLAFALPCAALLQWLSSRGDVVPKVAIGQGINENVTLAVQRRHSALPSSTVVFRRVDDAPAAGRARFSYSAAWDHLYGLNDGRSGGTSSRSFHVGATATIHFHGRGFRIYGVKGVGGGRAKVLIDGTNVGTLRFDAPRKEPGVLVFQTLLLRRGSHSAIIIVVPPSPVSFKRGYVNLDGAAYSL